MTRPSGARLLFGLGVLLPSASACNAVLGIDPPAEEVRTVDTNGVTAGDASPTDGDAESASDSDAQVQPEMLPDPGDWARWPMPNPKLGDLPNPLSYSRRVENIVIDDVTGLQWQQTVDEAKRSWEEAGTYCAQLELAGGGFRLPSRVELLSLLDFTQASPSLDTQAFPDSPTDKYWTSSRFVGTASSAWSVGFEFSTSYAFVSHKSERHWVRCVR